MIRHAALDLNYLTSCSLDELEGSFKNPQGEILEPSAVVAIAVILKAKGYEVLPPCKHHDARGHCKGHE